MSANSMFWQHLVLHAEEQQTQRRFSSTRTHLSRWSLLWEHFQSCVLSKLTALAAIALYLKPSASCQWQCKPLLAFISPTLELIGDCQTALYTLPVSEERRDNIPWIPTDNAILLQLQGWKITQGTARETCRGWYSLFSFESFESLLRREPIKVKRLRKCQRDPLGFSVTDIRKIPAGKPCTQIQG